MAIFYNSDFRNDGVIYKIEQNDCNTQGVIDCINEMIECNIPRNVHFTVEDAYSEIIKDFKNRIEVLTNYLDNISEYLVKFIDLNDYNIYEYILLKHTKIEFITNKINYINEFIKDLESNVNIVYDWTKDKNNTRVYYYDFDMLRMNNVF